MIQTLLWVYVLADNIRKQAGNQCWIVKHLLNWKTFYLEFAAPITVRDTAGDSAHIHYSTHLSNYFLCIHYIVCKDEVPKKTLTMRNAVPFYEDEHTAEGLTYN